MKHNEKVAIQNAIDRSRKNNDIVHLDWDASGIKDAIDWISETYRDVGCEASDQATKIWGWAEEMNFLIYLLAK